MTAGEVFQAIVAAGPGPEDIIYLGRSNDDYSWRVVAPGEAMMPDGDGMFGDAWMFTNVAWPSDADEESQRRFFDDMVAEMETMAAGADRCRWEFDDPYGSRH
jgi:hypothetical protein